MFFLYVIILIQNIVILYVCYSNTQVKKFRKGASCISQTELYIARLLKIVVSCVLSPEFSGKVQAFNPTEIYKRVRFGFLISLHYFSIIYAL